MFAADYRIRLDKYNTNVVSHRESLEGIKVHVQIESGAERFPSPLGFLSIGSDKKLGNTISGITFKEVPRETVGQSGGNFLMGMFPGSAMIPYLMRTIFNHGSLSAPSVSHSRSNWAKVMVS